MVTPSWSWLLTKWSLEPSIIVGMLVLTALYYYACGFRTTQAKSRLVCSGRQQVLFWLSQIILALALMSPLDDISDTYLFSAHMIQHLVLAAVWPPILLLSLPRSVVAPLYRNARGARVVTAVTLPPVAFLLFNGDMSVWHLPVLYDATLTNEAIHICEHLTFMATGLLVWWPVLCPIPERRLNYGLQELYLFANLFPMMALGIFFSFWQHPIYQPYINAPRLWGISPLTDQQIGGLIMWMPGDIPFAVAMLTIGINWLENGDPAERAPLSPVMREAGT